MTPVDSLDTLLLMGLTDEAEKAKSLIVEKLSFDRDVSVKNFEITIRLLGGLLSGYQMTRRPAAAPPGGGPGDAAPPGVRFADRHAVHVREPEDRQDERRPLEPRRDRHAPSRVRHAREADEQADLLRQGEERAGPALPAALEDRPGRRGDRRRDRRVGRAAPATSAAGSTPTTSTSSSARGSSATPTARGMWRESLQRPQRAPGRRRARPGSGTGRRTWRPADARRRSSAPCTPFCRPFSPSAATSPAPGDCRTRASGCGPCTGSSPRFSTTARCRSTLPRLPAAARDHRVGLYLYPVHERPALSGDGPDLLREPGRALPDRRRLHGAEKRRHRAKRAI